VAVALTAYFLWKADPARVVDVVATARPGWIAAAVALAFLDRALMAQRWIALLVALSPGSRPPIAEVLRVFFVSTFVGSFVPSVAGDVYRVYSLSRLRVSGAEAAASVLMDRLLGVLSIVIVGAVAVFAVDRGALDHGVVLALAMASVACAIAAAAVFSERAAAAAQALMNRMPHARLRDAGGRLVAAVRQYARHRGALISVLATSIGVQIIRVLQACCLGSALGLAMPLAVYFVAIPVILLVMLLPVTVNGLGTGQMAFEALFGRAGAVAPEAFALSILFIALGLVGNLPGGFLYAMGPRPESRRA
jgi:uncharacterized protein (TIRG00374 family)